MAELRAAIRAPLLDGVPHGFLTGCGGEGVPAGDGLVKGGVLVTARQVHSAIALPVSGPFAPEALPDADALATATPGLVLAIVTADCAPVLLADAEAGVVGAAHAGWRGALGGVLEAVVAAMVGLGARRGAIRAAIGPAIAQASYEVDKAFRDRFVVADAANARLFEAGPSGRLRFDLPAYVARRLEVGAGVGQIADLALDTYADPERFHSFRRATHLSQPTYGRQYSLIACPPPGG